ncbi:unnamed protein product [Rangifer tarandus platyrhynchus]|uniref:Uncharacterized protein n=2 Tax=Rangifer tarandus platyrhynchus TaxID=3082113 RepID=A0ACB0F3L2_RANTA|nr:unnamed protein product [Rangifer tarandus platyrhynchus]CAI9707088.1 unnamed protein product [Rangifer tarandus platyrhynchus]
MLAAPGGAPRYPPEAPSFGREDRRHLQPLSGGEAACRVQSSLEPREGPSPAVCDFLSGEKEHAGLALKDAPGHTHGPGFRPRQCDLEPVA